MRSLARDPRVLISWPLSLGFGLGGRLLLTGTAWAGLCLIHHNHHIKKSRPKPQTAKHAPTSLRFDSGRGWRFSAGALLNCGCCSADADKDRRVHRKVYYILHILQKNYTNKGAREPGRLLSVEAAAERPQARRTERELSVLVRSVVGLLRSSSSSSVVAVVVVVVARAQRRSLKPAIRDVERIGAMKKQLVDVVVVVVVLGHVDEARD